MQPDGCGAGEPGNDATSGIADCPADTCGGPDSPSASFNGSWRDQAGNVSARTFELKYNATPLAVTGATPDHPANSRGWFNTPVRLDIDGTDQTSVSPIGRPSRTAVGTP